MRNIKTIGIDNKRLLIRVDFNVPLENGSILDDSRIKTALPTIRYALEKKCRCVLMTHLGRPKGEVVPELKLDSVASRLSELLNVNVKKCNKVVGHEAEAMADNLKDGEIMLLENLRFDPGEKSCDEDFAAKLASMGEVYINDAFAACHRKHASMFAVPKHFQPDSRAIGFLIQKEIDALNKVRNSPKHPFVAIFGGIKVSDKIGTIHALINRVDRLLIGGAMSYAFMKARGHDVGSSEVEEGALDLAGKIIKEAGDKLVLPVDHVVSDDSEEIREIVDEEIKGNRKGMDIGPKTISLYQKEIDNANTVLWNGPMGKYENRFFAEGTAKIAEFLADSDAITLVGGGETGGFVRSQNMQDKMTHVSTGGGAFLYFMAHGTLPALDVLE